MKYKSQRIKNKEMKKIKNCQKKIYKKNKLNNKKHNKIK